MSGRWLRLEKRTNQTASMSGRNAAPFDEVSDDEEPQAQVQRAATGGMADRHDSIVAIAENRSYEIGVASIRLSDYSVLLASYCDDQALSKTLSVLASVEPQQVLIPPVSSGSLLERVVQANFADIH